MKDITRYHAKLTKEQVNQIMEYLRDERIKQEWIAKKFGVSQPTISRYNRKLKEEKILPVPIVN
jgi:DNA-binding Lrp family transcriptional regulator